MPEPMLLALRFSGERLWRGMIALLSFNVRMFFNITGDAVQGLPWLLLDEINSSLGLRRKKHLSHLLIELSSLHMTARRGCYSEVTGNEMARKEIR